MDSVPLTNRIYNEEEIMIKESFNKLFGGFLFIMFDFRLQGIDLFADIIGFILFALAFRDLIEHSPYFVKARTYSLVMTFVSVLTIYERPAQGEGVHVDPLGMVIGLVALGFSIAVGYYLFMGIRDMAAKRQQHDLEQEASQKWTYYLFIHLVGLLLYVFILIPILFVAAAFILFIANIVLMVVFMLFMKKCGEQFTMNP